MQPHNSTMRFGTTAGLQLRILIVDDDKTVRIALERLLSMCDGWTVVGEAGDGVEAIGKARELKPVVVMDVTMPQMNGLQATPEIKKVTPHTEVLIFTQHDSAQIVQEARHAGASGYLLKSQAGSLLDAVETVGQHKLFFRRGDPPSSKVS